ncbi:MAG: response regulator transcription factor [Verrucomicrobiae bacterium]|nr:response regulator transcription factor [Verrucomicrobiae bacterium]MCX7721597.1 response regulator transcription factor [Verrucomicrobiae bacterium]MDW7979288.1 response regulator transcription factor [Verrucomicrobiales bacterium]
MRPKKQIKVMVVDDHPAFRMGVAALVETQPDMVLACETGDGREVLELYRCHKPDIVLMDLRLQGMSGVEAVIALRKEFPDAKVIVLTTYDTDEDIYRACQAGVKSYLLKDTPKEEILAAIRAVHAGQPIMPNRVADRLAQRMLREDLSPRELDVLHALVKGRSNKEIAAALGISEPTVKTHLQNLFAKLGVQDRVGAVIAAIKHGIVHLE